MKKRNNGLSSSFSDLILIIGAVLVSCGIGMIYIPAGVIVFGLFLLAGGVLSGLSGGE